MVETAKEYNVDSFIIDFPEELDASILDKYNSIGVTSGASVPAYLIDRLVARIKKKYTNISILKKDSIEKDILFPLPPEIKDMRS